MLLASHARIAGKKSESDRHEYGIGYGVAVSVDKDDGREGEDQCLIKTSFISVGFHFFILPF